MREKSTRERSNNNQSKILKALCLFEKQLVEMHGHLVRTEKKVDKSTKKQGEQMGELLDAYNELRQAIVDEKAEVLAKLDELIAAGNSGEKITVAMLKEAKDEIQGMITTPPAENPVE